MLAVLLVVSAATAPGSGRVVATADGCAPGFASELRRLLTIELKVPVDASFDKGDTVVSVDCSSEPYEVNIEAVNRAPAKLQVDVAYLDAISISRTVALLVAEAVQRVWGSPLVVAEREPEKKPAPEPEPKPEVSEPPPPSEPATGELPGRVQVSVLGAGRISEVALLGGGIAADFRLTRVLGVRADVVALRGSAARASGDVSATFVDGGATLDVRFERPSAMARAGVGIRAGWGTLRGAPNAGVEAGIVSGVMWGPQASVSAEWRPVTWLCVGLGVDGGYWVPRLVGEVIGEAPVQVRGFFGAAWLSLGVRWW